MSGKPIDEAVVQFGLLLQRLRGQLANSSSDFAYVIVRDYCNELGDIHNALTAAQQQGQAVALDRMASAPVGVEGLAAQLRRELGAGTDKDYPYTEYEKGRVAEKERLLAILAQQPAAVEGAALQKMATRWLFDDGHLTGDPKIDEPTIHRGSAKRECAQELINFLAAQHQEPKS